MMITAPEILAECQARSIILKVEGERLRSEAPEGAMTADLREAIAQQRESVIECLRRNLCDSLIQQVIRELNEAGVAMNNLSESTKRETLRLEVQFTEAAMQGNPDACKGLVNRWRDLLLGKTTQVQLELLGASNIDGSHDA